MKSLKFIHIPKTGGTTIEILAIKKLVCWGMYDLEVFLPGWYYRPTFHIPIKHNDPLYLDYILQKYDFFCVVRNPYDKCVSEFYCKWELAAPKEKRMTIEDFNEYIQYRVLQNPDRDHWAAQSHFVYDQNGRKVVKHVLKYENLQEEFNHLMEQYGYNIRIGSSDRFNAGNKKFGVKDLSPETLGIINRVYHDDFINFGYAKV